MKHKKVLALLISAGLTASSLHGCSFMPQTAFGMETGEQKAAGEDMTDGTEENAQNPAPADEMPAPEEGEKTGSDRNFSHRCLRRSESTLRTAARWSAIVTGGIR